jgi:hypothetical protein
MVAILTDAMPIRHSSHGSKSFRAARVRVARTLTAVSCSTRIWESKDGHYRVRIKDKWWDVPAEAVITEPNKFGRTMVWPIYYWMRDSLERVEIRCFMPGAMT